MGQRLSRRISRLSLTPSDAQYPLTTVTSTTPTPNTILEAPQPPSPEITRPALQREITRLSTLIDPIDLMRADDDSITPLSPVYASGNRRNLVESPSGHLLEPHEYLDHPDRPLTIRERQDRIREGLMSAMSGPDLVDEQAAEGRSERDRNEGKAKAWKSCCGCLGSGRKKRGRPVSSA
ncbi:MAG: hypothetical protein M1830_006549 [Pleopsidium flavum]|nr:MAG: hypothetical protein M1830_006549 [Pleopsidium flavum]